MEKKHQKRKIKM